MKIISKEEFLGKIPKFTRNNNIEVPKAISKLKRKEALEFSDSEWLQATPVYIIVTMIAGKTGRKYQVSKIKKGWMVLRLK